MGEAPVVDLESFRRDSQRLPFCLRAWISVECAWLENVVDFRSRALVRET